VSHLDTAVRTVVRDCLAVSSGERVLVLNDSFAPGLAQLFVDCAVGLGADARPMQMQPTERDGQEPPPEVAEAMAMVDVVIAPTQRSLSHTRARRAASEQGVRIATLPGVTEDVLARAMSADPREVGRLAGLTAKRLTDAEAARITCDRGSDLTLSLSGRRGQVDDGRLNSKGAFGNLPCGEGYIAPNEDRGDGRLFVDGSIAGFGVLEEPVELTVEGGRLTGASGEMGKRLLDTLAAGGADTVAELGVGTNGRARASGNLLEDEKILGSVHVAFGSSAGIGGVVQAGVHIDCVVLKPELTLDGEPATRGGRLLIGS
jgi:leucyl aminopeptidase (aminopeptidase T)